MDIAQIVQERVALSKIGVTRKGPGPFHEEKIPSFGGDVIKFVEMHENVGFAEASGCWRRTPG